MKLNYLRIMRTTTNLTLLAFSFIAVAMTLWMADMLLGWDILPDWIQRYAELFITSLGLLTLLLVVSSFLTALVSLVELQAVNQTQPITPHVVRFKPQHKWFFLASLVVVIVIFTLFQQIDAYRKQQVIERDIQNFIARLERESSQLDAALADVLTRIPADLLHLIAKAEQLDKQDEIKTLTTFIHSLKLSIKDAPNMTWLLPASEPYRYILLGEGASYENDQLELNKTFLLKFVKQQETQYVQNLFNNNLTPLKSELAGQFIDNTEPSSWGVLQIDNQVVAIIKLQATIDNYYVDEVLRKKHDLFHDGPVKLLSNTE